MATGGARGAGEAPWWQTAVVYQIYPRSFCDSNGDGVGDLEGIRGHLDHIVELGVDAVWLSPFYRSPMADYGYDVSDFCDVDPLFGDLASFDTLLADCHERGLKVIVDWVPNHTSDRHPWFEASRSSRDDPLRDWYVWRDPSPTGGPPNNWVEALTLGPAWTLDARTGQHYLHCFLSEQPDLNWDNAEVEAAMHDTLRFWLDRGVDGFRMDVVHLIGKDPILGDAPPELAGLPQVVLNDRAETHDRLRRIRRLIDSYPADRMAIGEVYLLDTDLVSTYYGTVDEPELHLSFNFPPLQAPWDARRWQQAIRTTEEAHLARDAWPSWVLSNHDNPRHRTRYSTGDPERDERICRAAAVLLLTLRGTPFLYAGEELGLSDAVVAESRRRDPAGRDGCRAPIPWEREAPHGWRGDDTWLPWPPEPERRSVEAQRTDPTSMLSWYRRVVDLRRSMPALQLGSLDLIETPDGVVAWRRTSGDEGAVVAINMTGAPVALGHALAVEVAGAALRLSTAEPDSADSADAAEAPMGPDEARVWRLG